MSYSESSLLCVCVLENKIPKGFNFLCSRHLLSSLLFLLNSEAFFSFKLLCGLRTSSGLGKGWRRFAVCICVNCLISVGACL